MVRRYALPIALAVLSAPAGAAEISVQDFGDMTRISIPVGPNQEWKLDRDSQSVRMSTTADALDLSAKAVPANGRLAKLDIWRGGGETGVDIVYRCDCVASSYMADSRAIVIDIAERVVPAKGVTTVVHTEPVLPAAEEKPETVARLRRAPREKPTETAEAAVSAPISIKPVKREARVESQPGAPTPHAAYTLVATPLPPMRPYIAKPGSPEDAVVDAVRDSVLSQLSDAADQGIVAFARPEKSGRDAVKLAPGCPDEAALDLGRLTNTVDFREPLPRLRAAVLDDMKQVSPGAVRALARHFIAFGMGTEARAVINAFETEGKGEQLLLDMAALLDGEYEGLQDNALFQPDCGPRASVWRAALAAATHTGNVSAIYPQTDGTVFDLPDNLRKIVGARIALGLMDEHDIDRAKRIWRSLEHAQGPVTPEMRLLEAYIDSPHSPLHALLQIANTRTPEAVSAALRAASILTESDQPRSADKLIQILEDMTFIYRGSEYEDRLAFAHAELSGRYGNLASALAELQKRIAAEPKNVDRLRKVVHETIRAATESADPTARPGDFETILRAQAMLDDSPESDTARNLLARKLIDAGAAHIVAQVLTPKVLKRSVEARRLMAEAMLLKGDGAKALSLLGGGADADSDALRQRAETLDASAARASVRRRFEAMPRPRQNAPLANARQLIDETDTDLSTVEELLADG